LWHNEAQFREMVGTATASRRVSTGVRLFRRHDKSSAVLGDRNQASQVRVSAVRLGVCR